jgi:hypothetical protein
MNVSILHQSHGFIQTQGNVQVLHGRTTCSLAQVIKSRTQDNLLGRIIRKDKELQLVGILELIRRQKDTPLQQTRFLGTGFAQGHDFDEYGSFVVLFQARVDLGASGSFSQPRIVQGDRDDHALVKVGNSRLEDGFGSQARVLGHFRNVLVREIQSVRAPRFVLFRLVQIHQGLATTGISRNGIDRQGCTDRQDTSVHQGFGEANKTGWVATRVRNALGRLQLDTLFLAQFCDNNVIGM